MYIFMKPIELSKTELTICIFIAFLLFAILWYFLEIRKAQEK